MSYKDLAISIRGLSKRYKINREQSHSTLTEQLLSSLRHPFGGGKQEFFHALTDVDMDVKKGDVLGLVGRNGAGKSTLLKILSRITEPTQGEVRLYGRVGSLLEIGTGFHPELTGRENIFLNGQILGMRRHEIRKQFDAIVDFANIEQFLETPVKRYSSGMYVRLAFAVAAHLNPEILIVDEVLAVGDQNFQKKCLGKMQEVSTEEGRTIIFVSHNMAAVRSLCNTAALMDGGRMLAQGPSEEIVTKYLSSLEEDSQKGFPPPQTRPGKGQGRFTRCTVYGEQPDSPVSSGSPMHIEFELDRTFKGLHVTFITYNNSGEPITLMDSAIHAPEDDMDENSPLLICQIPECPFNPGSYRINISLWTVDLQDRVEGAVFFDVHPGVMAGRPVNDAQIYSKVAVRHAWFSGSTNPAARSGLQAVKE